MSETIYRTDSDELRIDGPQPEAPEAPKEHDPQSEARMSIAEKYEQRRLEEIKDQREQMGLPRDEPVEEVPEEVAPPASGEEVKPEAPQARGEVDEKPVA